MQNYSSFRADEEELLDNDISYEFHRESHHIHSIPRTEISQVNNWLYKDQ